MALSRRQLILYTYRVDLYEPKLVTSNGGTPTYSYSLAKTDVPCYPMFKTSLSAPEDFGQIERDIFGTLDVWHFDEEEIVDDQWYLVVKTPGPYLGKAWKTRGNPVKYQQGGRRRGDHLMIEAAFHDHPEEGIPGA